MAFIYVFLLFFSAFKNVLGDLDPELKNNDLPGNSFRSSSASYSGNSPLNKAKLSSGTPDADLKCENECQSLQKTISFMLQANPDSSLINYLHNTCGTVTSGQCTTAMFVPICWCLTTDASKSQQSTPLLYCRSKMEFIRTLTLIRTKSLDRNDSASNPKRTTTDEQEEGTETEQIGMAQWISDRFSPRGRRPGSATSIRPNTHFRPITPGATASSSSSSARRPWSGPHYSPPREEEIDFNTRPDNVPEGPADVLWTYVQVEGQFVRAMIDTGSSHTFIHPDYTGKKIQIPDPGLRRANRQPIQVKWKTTIKLEIRKDVFVDLTGLVTDLDHRILLGTNFYHKYKAKLRIPERAMVLTVNKSPVRMKLRFQPEDAEVSMMDSDATNYSSLKVSVIINNRHPTRMVVDTGASDTVVSTLVVNTRHLRSDPTIGLNMSGTIGNAMGKMDVSLNFEFHTMKFKAIIPKFIPTNDMVAGNDFNKRYVVLIDYEKRNVLLRFPDPVNEYTWVSTQAFIFKRQ